MFIKALEKNKEYIKPVINGYKTPYKDDVYESIATIMLINDEGWALTCKHVAESLIYADEIMKRYENVKKELLDNKVPPKKIYKKYGIKDDDAVILRNVFLGAVDSWKGLQLVAHPNLDMALIKFENPNKIFCKHFPVFSKTNAKVGEFVCRTGYPYQDINCFKYNHSIRDLIITENFEPNLQPFPLEGMVTRYLIDNDKKMTLFEISNPTLKGQDGGPIINKDGFVVGLQIGNSTKDVGITINTELKRDNKIINIQDYPLLNFGVGINVDTIKQFLNDNNVEFKEEK